MEVHQDETYLETDYNKKYHAESKPFIETETAGQLLDAFESTGLTLGDTMRGIITETDLDTRFGQAYAAMTREIAKLVNDPERQLDRLFNDEDGAAPDKIRALGEVQDPAARVVINLLKGIVNRTEAPRSTPVIRPRNVESKYVMAPVKTSKSTWPMGA